MAKDDFTAPQAPEHAAAVSDAPEEQPAQVVSEPDPVEDTSPVSEPSDAPEPNFNISLNPDSDLEAPVYLTVPGLYSDVEPLPHPDDIKDDDGEFLPGYDASTPTLVQTEDGWERPSDADQSEAVVPVDEHGRIELSDSPVSVPSSVARVVEGLPFVRIEAVTS